MFNVYNIFLFPESRETAYIYAISSAGITHSVTRACAKGELEGCGCDDSVRQKATGGEFEWGGCSENLKYGGRFAEEFVDSKEVDVTENGMMNLWNNKAGRLVSTCQCVVIIICCNRCGSLPQSLKPAIASRPLPIRTDSAQTRGCLSWKHFPQLHLFWLVSCFTSLS